MLETPYLGNEDGVMARKQPPARPTARRYTPDEKAQAVRLVRTLRDELGTAHGTVQRVANQLGYGVESVRSWVHQADVDDGLIHGSTTSDAKKLRELEQEAKELRRANAMADSTGRRNELSEPLRWCHIAEGLAWTPIETALNCAQLRWSDGRKVHALGQVLAQ